MYHKLDGNFDTEWENNFEFHKQNTLQDFRNLNPFERENAKKEAKLFFNKTYYRIIVYKVFDIINYDLKTQIYTTSYDEDYNDNSTPIPIQFKIPPETAKKIDDFKVELAMVFYTQIRNFTPKSYVTKDCEKFNQFARNGCLQYKNVKKEGFEYTLDFFHVAIQEFYQKFNGNEIFYTFYPIQYETKLLKVVSKKVFFLERSVDL